MLLHDFICIFYSFDFLYSWNTVIWPLRIFVHSVSAVKCLCIFLSYRSFCEHWTVVGWGRNKYMFMHLGTSQGVMRMLQMFLVLLWQIHHNILCIFSQSIIKLWGHCSQDRFQDKCSLAIWAAVWNLPNAVKDENDLPFFYEYLKCILYWIRLEFMWMWSVSIIL